MLLFECIQNPGGHVVLGLFPKPIKTIQDFRLVIIVYII